MTLIDAVLKRKKSVSTVETRQISMPMFSYGFQKRGSFLPSVVVFAPVLKEHGRSEHVNKGQLQICHVDKAEMRLIVINCDI